MPDTKDNDPSQDVNRMQSQVLGKFNLFPWPRKPLGKPTGHSSGGNLAAHAAGFRKPSRSSRPSRKQPFGGSWD